MRVAVVGATGAVGTLLLALLERRGFPADEIAAHDVLADNDIAKVSLVGAGMKTNPGVGARMFETLADAGINIEMISTSPIRITCVVRSDQVEQAVQELHRAFELEA